MREKLSPKEIKFLAQVHGPLSDWLVRPQIFLLLLGSESLSAFNKQVLMKHCPSSIINPGYHKRNFSKEDKTIFLLENDNKIHLKTRKQNSNLIREKNKWRFHPLG